jgi:Trypsin
MKKNLIHSPRLALVLAIACFTEACALSSSTPLAEVAETTAEPITGGQPVNNGADEVAPMFPLSTVTFHCTFPETGGGQCTGALLSTIQILTAAHCCPLGGTVDTVWQYNATRGNAAPAAIATYTAPFPIPMIPPGVTGGNTSGYDSTGNYADLALITLPAPLPLPATIVLPGLPGSYPTVRGKPLWEVGSGLINGGPNPDRLLEWVPLANMGVSDTSGQFSGLNATTNDGPGNPGDSGGPVYEKIAGALFIVGITSFGNSDSPTYFTSVLSSTNHSWIMDNYVGPASPQDVQRGRKLVDRGDHAPVSLVTSLAQFDRADSVFPELLSY